MSELLKKNLVLATSLIMAGIFTLADASNIEKGRMLFESPTLGGGTTGKNCLTCHFGGRGLRNDLFKRKKITINGMTQKGLAQAINFCIENPLGGVAIEPQGLDMQKLISYIRTLISQPSQK